MCQYVGWHETHQYQTGQSARISAARVFAAAAATVMNVQQKSTDAADIAAAAAWARVPADAARVFEVERTSWLATQHAEALPGERNGLGRRSVLAATLAAGALERGSAAVEIAASGDFRDAMMEVIEADPQSADRQ